jgi:FtsP/CotA-like multicopper oxidase with cupredoxin domain
MRASVLIVILGCGGTNERENISPQPFTDTNPDPDIVEVRVVAELATHTYLAGKPADVWAFRDGAVAGASATIPGPLLDAKLGDRVIVHFKNDLPEETTIHWHGLRVPNASDGTPSAQVPVPPGGSYDYEFVAIDPGLYWYHPHMRGDIQIEAGLYAPIRIRAPLDASIDVAVERVFVLDDVKLAANGQLATSTDNLDMMLGRQGNVLLVNGRETPTIAAAAGSRERWRFVNTANGRYFQLDLPGHTFRVIGWDGGYVTTPYETQRLLIAPGERYDVLVDLQGASGDSLELRTVHYDRGHSVPDPGPKTILAIELDAEGKAPAPLPTSWGDTAALVVDAATSHRQLTLQEDDSVPGEPVFTINGEAFPAITPLQSQAGRIEIWDIENASEMDHPFHLHGMSFQVLDATGQPKSPLAWKDTVNVPRETTLSFAVQLGEAGRWMYHCHILEHAERGMMGELQITP